MLRQSSLVFLSYLRHLTVLPVWQWRTDLSLKTVGDFLKWFSLCSTKSCDYMLGAQLEQRSLPHSMAAPTWPTGEKYPNFRELQWPWAVKQIGFPCPTWAVLSIPVSKFFELRNCPSVKSIHIELGEHKDGEESVLQYIHDDSCKVTFCLSVEPMASCIRDH